MFGASILILFLFLARRVIYRLWAHPPAVLVTPISKAPPYGGIFRAFRSACRFPRISPVAFALSLPTVRRRFPLGISYTARRSGFDRSAGESLACLQGRFCHRFLCLLSFHGGTCAGLRWRSHANSTQTRRSFVVQGVTAKVMEAAHDPCVGGGNLVLMVGRFNR